MKDVPRRADDFLQHVQVAFIWRHKVAATQRRHLLRQCERIKYIVVDRNPTWRRGTGAATFRTVLDIDLVEVLSFSVQPRQVSQYGLTQAHAGGSRQQNNRGCPLLMMSAKRFDDLLNLFAVLALRH